MIDNLKRIDIDTTKYFTYDNNNRLFSYWFDYRGDGIANQTKRNTYNSYGKISKTYEDLDGDGVSERIRSYHYDSNQNLVREYRKNSLGGPISLTKYTWGEFQILSFNP